jgi:hypothetical protein
MPQPHRGAFPLIHIEKEHQMNTQFNFVRRAFKLAMLSAFALGGVAVSGHSLAATATGDANATVVTPMGITKGTALQFGKFAAGTGGTVVMSTAGVRSKTDGVVLSRMDVGTAATFNVTGDGASTYAITLPGTAVNLANGANTMSLGSFVSDPSGTGTLTSGAQTLNVGGTLTVASAQAVGTYTGTYDVTVEYN